MTKQTFDAETIRQLADLLKETELSEIEFEQDGCKVRVARTLSESHTVVAASTTSAPEPIKEAPEPKSIDPADHPGAVKSPMVGNVYLAPEPGAPTFVQEGDSVAEGQTLLIIEAMKVMNPIRAPRTGIIKRVLVSNAAPVEFDEPMMIIE